MYESSWLFFSEEAVISVESLRHLVLPSWYTHVYEDCKELLTLMTTKYYYYTCWLMILQVLLQTSIQVSLETVNVHLLLSTFHHPPLAISAVVCHPSSTIYSLPRLTSTVYHPWSVIHHLPSTIYRPPSTVHHLPSTIYLIVCRLPFTVYRPPSTVHRLPPTLYQPPSTI